MKVSFELSKTPLSNFGKSNTDANTAHFLLIQQYVIDYCFFIGFIIIFINFSHQRVYYLWSILFSKSFNKMLHFGYYALYSLTLQWRHAIIRYHVIAIFIVSSMHLLSYLNSLFQPFIILLTNKFIFLFLRSSLHLITLILYYIKSYFSLWTYFSNGFRRDV